MLIVCDITTAPESVHQIMPMSCIQRRNKKPFIYSCTAGGVAEIAATTSAAMIFPKDVLKGLTIVRHYR